MALGDKIKSASQAAAADYDSYSDGVTNNTYKSISGSEVTLKTEGNWSEDFTDVNRERLGAAEAEMFGKYAFGITVGGSLGNSTQSLSLAFNFGTGQAKIFHTAGLKIGAPSFDAGVSLFQMNAYGDKDGAKYNNVFEGATGYSTEVSGSYFVGGSHSFSASDNSIIGRADYGTQATSINVGVGYDVGASRTYTTDITQKVNNAPSAISGWLRKNINHSPEIN